jgi:hypothetical protein
MSYRNNVKGNHKGGTWYSSSLATLCSRINDSSPRDGPMALGLPSMASREVADLNQEIGGERLKGKEEEQERMS